jgi:hypothetical protein
MLPLPPHTTFSQSGLADWRKCQRLFQYRHIQRRVYPAPETDDMLAFEDHMARGEAFHHLVHQFFSGVDAQTLTARIREPQLATWWDAFQAHVLPTIPARRYAEASLTAPLGEHRLLAKYDLIAVNPDTQKLIIYDWKTALRRPTRANLEQRAQTLVYRYLMVRAGAYYLGWSPVEPEQVEMVYWFANFPTEPERFTYDAAQFAADEGMLTGLVDEIAAEREFPTVDEADRDRVCRYCVYRTRCWDDVAAGTFDGLFDEDTPTDTEADGGEIDLDFGQIAEVQF